ncbi:MAG: DUF2703 domain-containing protein [Eubacteriales bacterium]
MSEQTTSCCSCGSGCCGSEQPLTKIVIDFLYLDLSVCERCQGTESNLEEAIVEVAGVLKAAGYEICTNKVNIVSKELAIKYRFLSSPTIRINGQDLDLDVKESACKECGDLCGDDVDCRVWMYEGVEYTKPPKAMIINAILSEVYSKQKTDLVKTEDYELPDNLRMFFDGLKGMEDDRKN